ncbi:MAG: hypothetical protein ACFFEL_16170, partial [Candidatus Thorarchaeota archaeon]
GDESESTNIRSGENIAAEEEELHDMIRDASVEEPSETSDDMDPELKLTAADVVSAREKKRRIKVKDIRQLSLLDDLEFGEPTSGAGEESGSASV